MTQEEVDWMNVRAAMNHLQFMKDTIGVMEQEAKLERQNARK